MRMQLNHEIRKIHERCKGWLVLFETLIDANTGQPFRLADQREFAVCCFHFVYFEFFVVHPSLFVGCPGEARAGFSQRFIRGLNTIRWSSFAIFGSEPTDGSANRRIRTRSGHFWKVARLEAQRRLSPSSWLPPSLPFLRYPRPTQNNSCNLE